MGGTCTRNCRFCNIHPGKPAPLDPEGVARITALVESGREEEALSYSRARQDPFSRIVRAGLENRPYGLDEVKDAIENAGRQEVPRLQRFLGALGTIAAISPLLGLLGTVLGMIKVFAAISISGLGDPQGPSWRAVLWEGASGLRTGWDSSSVGTGGMGGESPVANEIVGPAQTGAEQRYGLFGQDVHFGQQQRPVTRHRALQPTPPPRPRLRHRDPRRRGWHPAHQPPWSQRYSAQPPLPENRLIMKAENDLKTVHWMNSVINFRCQLNPNLRKI